MRASVRDLMIRGVAAAKAGDKDEARFYLEWVLRTGETEHEDEIKAWYWLSRVTDDPSEKRSCLESALAIDPFDPLSRRELAILDGRLDPDAIVDPDTVDTPGTDGALSLCPECGGPLIFAPDGTERVCERCGWQPERIAMNGDSPDLLLERGIAAAKAKDYQSARACLLAVARGSSPPALRIQAWFWLSGVANGVKEKRDCLEAVLRLDPENRVARRGLAFLDAQPEEAPEDAAPPPPAAVLRSKRFTCTQCGGKMVFEPGGNTLRCSYCGRKQSLLAAMQAGAMVEEHDFTIALATTEGHSHPVGMRPFQCQGCGASFMLAPGVLSLSCSYCGSAHVVAMPKREVVLPEGLIPFVLSYEQARDAFRRWLQGQGPKDIDAHSDIRGLYLPLWTFDVGGALGWKCVVEDHDYNTHVPVPKTGDYPLDYDDVLVAASHTLPADLMAVVETFDSTTVVPYDPGYLADWPAEVYGISASDASLVARQKVLRQARHKVMAALRDNELSGDAVSNLTVDSSKLFIYAYKLILVPAWIGHYHVDGTTYDVVINGQSGHVRGQKPASWLRKLVGGLFD